MPFPYFYDRKTVIEMVGCPIINLSNLYDEEKIHWRMIREATKRRERSRWER